MLTGRSKNIVGILAALSLFGVVITSYLTLQHYKDPGTSFCNVNEYVSCDIVNKSIYAEVLGIPVAIGGLGAYILLSLASLALLYKKIPEKETILASLVFTGIGFCFSLYLTFLEFFVIRALCIFCLIHQVNILIIFLLFLYLWQHTRKSLLAS